MAETPKCSRCGAELPRDAPGGHCLKCLLLLGLTPEPDSPAEISEPAPLPQTKPAPPTEASERIGRYKLLQPIGEGGCGVVYLAAQEEPVRRRVALKIIKLGMDTRQVVARFEAERQALALMEHPNIAQVFDGGATASGRPYFVMELVCGIKITDYCNQKQLSTRQRLDLFLLVCQAIQHAHQKGVIHRDIKPSNILVTEQDGEPVPKVIDFGIAKATTGQQLTDKTMFTAFEQFVGTPAYMSPEQAGLGRLDIDTRSDTYSLGVLLYELLTGQPPFEAGELRRAALDQVLRTIREKEPLRPSVRLTLLARPDLTTVARERQIEAARLPSLVRGDLDWIVMKCLEKDRRRRYETVNGLARDVQRHLDSEPVVARPASNYYRFYKWTRRNKLAFAATSAICGSLLLGIGVSTRLLFKEKAAYREAKAAGARETKLRQEADAASRAAEAQARRSRQMDTFLMDILQGASPQVALARDSPYFQELLAHAAQDAGVDLKDHAEEAEIMDTLGATYNAFGMPAQAEPILRQALRDRRSLPEQDPALLAQSLANLGRSLMLLGKSAEAEPAFREALDLRNETASGDGALRARAINSLASALWDQRKVIEAEARFRQALTLCRNLPPTDQGALAEALNGLASVLRYQQQLGQAEQLQREAVRIQQARGGETYLTADLLGNLALILSDRGRLTDAERTARRVLELRRRLLPSGHPDIAKSLSALAEVLRRQHRLEEAEGLQREALASVKSLAAGAPPLLATHLAELAAILQDQEKFAQAEQLYREALGIGRQFQQGNPPAFEAHLVDLANCLESQNRTVEAEKLYREALANAQPAATNDARRFEGRLLSLANSLLCQHRYLEAEPLLRRALASAHEFEPNGPTRVPTLLADLGRCLCGRKDLRGAEAFYREALASLQPFALPDPRAFNSVLLDLGLVLQSQGKLLEAAQLLSRDRPSAQNARQPEARLLRARGVLSAGQGHWVAAAADLTRVVELEPDEYWNWFNLVPLLLETGQDPAYRKHRDALLDRFHAPGESALAYRVLVVCLLVPFDDAEQAKQAGVLEVALQPDNCAWAEVTKGLATYRQGHFTNAVQWAHQALARPNIDSRCAACACGVLALACQRLNHPGDAGAALARGTHLLDTQMPKSGPGDLFPEWLIARALIREAVALHRGPPGASAAIRKGSAS
jgi:eukaryotic-like serine/threonine-protein kinase